MDDQFTVWGRAESPEAKRAAVEQLLEIWLNVPELRLGQLIGNVVSDEKRLYFLEDRPLLEELAASYARWKQERAG